MDFKELAKERYSVRKFSEAKVEKEKLELILESGRISPTAANFQPQRILVIDSEQNLEKLKTCSTNTFDAPVVLLICYDSTTSWKRKFDQADMGVVDASIVTAQMMFQAAELGLGSTWVAHFDPDRVRSVFELPDYLIPVALLPIGYKSSDSTPHALHNKRFPMEESVYFNSFEGITPKREQNHY